MKSKKRKDKSFRNFILSFYSPVRGLFILMMVLMLLAQVCNLVGMYSIKNMVNMPFKDGFNLNDLYTAIIVIGVAFVIDVFARYSSMTIRSIPLRKKQSEFATKKLFDHLNKKNYTYFTDNYSGKIANAISDVPTHIDRINKVLLQDIFTNIGGMISNFVILFSINIWIALISLIFYTGIVVCRLIYFKLTYIKEQRLAENERREFNGLLNDSIMNFTSLRVYNSVDAFSDNVVGQKMLEMKHKNKGSKHEFKYGFTVNFLHVVVLIAVAIFGVSLYKDSMISIGDFVFILTCMISIKNSTTSISWQIIDMSDTMVVLNKSYELLYDENNIEEESKPDIIVGSGNLEIKNLYFKYSNDYVFEDFNLKIADKSKIGIIGISGSGKSTLVSLLFKFYKPESGSIEIDGKNINDYNNHSLYKNLTYVPQETILLHSTIFENLKLAKPDATDDEIFEASKKAELHEFIETLPNKYQTIVGERGIKLSGGQRQRIALARIFLKDTKIVVFDEATSALDNETEFKIQKNINSYLSDRTIICIAHRLSTLVDMDKIIVIEDGKLIDSGSPKKIIAKYSKVGELNL